MSALVSLRQRAQSLLQLPPTFSVRHDLLAVPDLPGGGSLRRALLFLDAIHRFAPELRLHPDDGYLPSSVPWYLARVRMRRHRQWAPDDQILNRGDVTAESLVSVNYDGHHSSGGGRTEFFIQLVDDDDRRGDLGGAVCYVHFFPAPDDPSSHDVQYWFFYPYNGNITSVLHIAHEGDWEHLTVRLREAPDGSRSIAKVFFATHKKESEWRGGGLAYTEDGHLIAWPSRHSHATYWEPGEHERSGPLPNDYSADGGPIWRTWERLVATGELHAPIGDQIWIRYNGHWGELGAAGTSGAFVSSGPHGPAFQPWWRDEDEMLRD